MRATTTALFAILSLSVSCGAPPPPYGPYWTGTSIQPAFSAMRNMLSTSFNGHVYPETHFVFGQGEGFVLDKPNAKLSVIANTVWQYAPIVVALYDGPRDAIGTPANEIVRWEVPPPPLGGAINFDMSQSLGGRTPAWAVIDFLDFAGNCNFQILGHD